MDPQSELVLDLLANSPVAGIVFVVLYWARGEIREMRTQLTVLAAKHEADMTEHIRRLDARDAALLTMIREQTEVLRGMGGSLDQLADISALRDALRSDASRPRE